MAGQEAVRQFLYTWAGRQKAVCYIQKGRQRCQKNEVQWRQEVLDREEFHEEKAWRMKEGVRRWW